MSAEITKKERAVLDAVERGLKDIQAGADKGKADLLAWAEQEIPGILALFKDEVSA